MEYECQRCNSVKDGNPERVKFKSYDSLRKHVGRIHKVDSTTFYVEFYLDGKWPTCQCGCENRTKWSHHLKGFRMYSAGHQSRVSNNWGHNKSALKKSLETRIKRFDSGELTTWNSGLTKHSDKRLENQGITISNTIKSNPIELKRRADSMSKNRKNGTVPTLYGPQSSQWKGGISEVNNIARSDKRLYDEWKYPILVRDGFKCVECGNSGSLHVHHNKETMSEIVKKHVVDNGFVMSFDLKKCIAGKIVDYHIQQNVSGVTLCGDCHQKFHPSLNFD